MASLREKLEAELEQMDYALSELPSASQINKLSVLELAGTASLLSSIYHVISLLQRPVRSINRAQANAISGR